MQQEAGRTQGRNLSMFPWVGMGRFSFRSKGYLKPGVSLNSHSFQSESRIERSRIFFEYENETKHYFS